MEKKPFYLSKSFWGIVIMALGLYAPRFAKELQGSLDDVITLVGLVITLVGRWTAKQPLTLAPPKQTAVLVLLPVLALSVCAQDRVKVSASFVNSDFTFGNAHGIAAEGDAKILRYEKIRLGGVFQFVRPSFDTCRKIDTYSLGPQVSYDAFNGRISIFGRALFGVTDLPRNYAFTKTYGAGADVNIGHIFIRPIVLDFQRIEGFPTTINRFGAGGGVRF